MYTINLSESPIVSTFKFIQNLTTIHLLLFYCLIFYSMRAPLLLAWITAVAPCVSLGPLRSRHSETRLLEILGEMPMRNSLKGGNGGQREPQTVTQS